MGLQILPYVERRRTGAVFQRSLPPEHAGGDPPQDQRAHRRQAPKRITTLRPLRAAQDFHRDDLGRTLPRLTATFTAMEVLHLRLQQRREQGPVLQQQLHETHRAARRIPRRRPQRSGSRKE